MPTTDVGRRLKAMLDDSDYRGNAKALSLDADLGETAVRDIIEGRSKKPRFDTLAKIAHKLKRPVEHLLGDLAMPNVRGGGALAEELPPYSSRVPARPRRRDDLIPIKGAGRGGTDQEMFLEEVGSTPRPASLEGVREAYAIYMVGDSMSPRYEQGWLLHINPFKPPTPGRCVVIYKTNNAVLIKRLLRRTETEVIVDQLNPPSELRIPASEVREMHLIVGSDEEGG